MISSDDMSSPRFTFWLPLLGLIVGGVLISLVSSLSPLLAGLVGYGALLGIPFFVRLRYKQLVTLLILAIVIGPIASLNVIPGSSLQLHLADLVVPIVAVTYIRNMLSGRSTMNPGNQHLFFALGVLVLATVPSLLLPYSLSRSAGTLRYIWFGFLAYALLLQWKTSESDLRFAMKLLVAGGGFLGLRYATQALLPRFFLVRSLDTRLEINFLSASVNYVSLIFVAFVVLALAVAQTTTRIRLRIAALVLAGCLAFLAVVTASRVAILGLAVSLGVYFLQRHNVSRASHYRLVMVLLVFLIAMVVFLISSNPYFQLRYFSTLELLKLRSWDALLSARPGTELDWGDWYRIRLWMWYMEEIPRHLWFGRGLGGVSTPYFGGILMPAHNLVLELLSGVGVVGTVAYGLLLVWTYRRVRRSPFSRWQAAFASVARSWFWAILVASLLHPFMTTGYQTILLLWVLLALGSANVS
jgi:hypothetical protein